ncbi:hypothetical protein QM806_33685 [Rhodococcus sp. IEGM 1351]|uniref:hypothetical protein n=1 Tax=Rhodococcus sp. IEGM 1351 TaxID=3047089 RepID=UPI0024B8212D|nr:hypothetical protein [Rhodococcus sp. IEGM 1351]MDI9940328.1 hypothetical protein [Rhodococcus sp. IEGM 1351]
MTKNSSKKKAARTYQTTHPGTTFPEALRAVEHPASDVDDAIAPVDAQPALAADDDWPVGGLVETIWAMDAEANGGVEALRRNRLADWVARARAVHRGGWSVAEPWSSGEREAAAWILDDHDAMGRFETTPAEIVTRLGYDIQARSRAEAERYLGLAKATFAAEQDPTGPAGG